MVSAQFLLVASLTTLFWAPRALLANLKCKKMIVKRMTFIQANRQLAVHVHLFLRSLIYSATALICLSASDISPEISGHCLLFHKSICVASTSSIRFPDCWLKCYSPSSLLNLAACRLLAVVTAPVKTSESSCQSLDFQTFFAVYFVWVFASFQLKNLRN